MKYEKLECGKFYHVFNQGNNKENIFIEEMNYSYFFKLMKKHIVPVADIFSYCLLKNHFHWLIQVKEEVEQEKVSSAFSNFFNSYSKSINKKYNRTGSLFRDRFKRVQVKNEKYLKALIVYINLNPVYHNFVNKSEEYKYSSYLSLLSDKKTLLKRNVIISMFEGKENLKYYLFKKKWDFDNKFSELTFE
ncbi:Transposase IS200 like [Tenacibaculum sp. MAR_2009_124]|uniref:transposase n=1 Tax=Tenacibaculum sp. MAR_2009_124 TaxID=1250059 RepID=UPI00089D7E8B|nr:transposase [Tenacibaculum sp. MAR_2009_124]SEC86527.1 Transposase IS200 like [Tenacibaculum sp. MAR_2009_124]